METLRLANAGVSIERRTSRTARSWRRKASPINLAAAVALACLVTLAGSASAQNLPPLRELADLDYYTATWVGPKADDWFSLAFLAGGLGRLDLQPDRETSGGLAGFARLMASAGLSPTLELHLDSSAQVPMSLDGDRDSVDLDRSRLLGHHRAWGRFGLGRIDESRLGLDLSLDYRLDHTGGATPIVRPELLPHGLVDQSLEAGIWLRRGMNCGIAFVLPLRYRWRRVDYLDAADSRQEFVTHTFSSGFGLRNYFGGLSDGWLELVGISWSHSELDSSPPGPNNLGGETTAGSDPDRIAAVGGPPLPSIEQLDLRFGNTDKLVFLVSNHVALSTVFFLGASWIWNDLTSQRASLFTFGYGVEGRFGNDAHHGTAGVSITRHPGWTPSGERLVANQHLELIGEFVSERWGVGARHRSLFDWFSHPEIEVITPLPSPVPAMTLYTEWFMEMWRLELGTYHRAQYGNGADDPASDPWERSRGWSHEFGLFLRWGESFGLGRDTIHLARD
ncbi:MAG: hypothetical protein JW797_01735 [Bradymonadales bacterium]|nr:hypothetical protein [Bradymonadales bacterium]